MSTAPDLQDLNARLRKNVFERASFLTNYGIRTYPVRYPGEDYEKDGHRVKANGKESIGSHDKFATSDLPTLERWNEQEPQHNTAALASETIFELDDDTGVWEQYRGPKAETLVVRRGNRNHVYYGQTERSRKLGAVKQDKTGGAFSVRGINQYLVGPGSRHASGDYYDVIQLPPGNDLPPAPDEFIAFLESHIQKRSELAGVAQGKIPNGQRNDWLTRQAGKLRNAGIDDEEIMYSALVDSADKNFEERATDHETKTRDLARRAVQWTIGSPETKAVVVPDLPFWAADDLLRAELAQRELLSVLNYSEARVAVEKATPVLTGKSVNQIVGFRGSGKSNFELSWAVALACGTDFLCYQTVRACRVLYIDGELPDEQIQERLQYLTSSKTPCSVSNLYVVSVDKLRKEGLVVPYINSPEGRASIERLCELLRVDILILDSMSTLMSLGTNDEENWIEINNWFIQLRSKGLCVKPVMHAGKNQGLGSRAHSRAEDQPDLNIQLTALDEESDNLHCKLEYKKIRGNRRGIRNLEIEWSPEVGWRWKVLNQESIDAAREILKAKPDISCRELSKELSERGETVSKNKAASILKQLRKEEMAKAGF
jgi:AAA domain/Bifunctional DNA primase/polymerase, N-terminal/Primase C terminal 1 (PriCT-1)